MHAARLSLTLALVFTLGACAHSQNAPQKSAPPARVPAAERPAMVDPDADGDGVPSVTDPCPLEPGAPGSDGCPPTYGYFFLRVIDADTRTPVTATLVFTPSVTRVVGEDDGFTGTVAPGVYRVQALAPGYAPGELGFDIAAQAKARLELTLRKTSR